VTSDGQKRPVFGLKETSVGEKRPLLVKKDLSWCKKRLVMTKRDLSQKKETSYDEKRHLFVKKRPLISKKNTSIRKKSPAQETCMYEKRPLLAKRDNYPWKETCHDEKRPLFVKRVLPKRRAFKKRNQHYFTHNFPLAIGWLQSEGSIKSQVSFAEYSLFYRSLLLKRPMIWSILLTEANP